MVSLLVAVVAMKKFTLRYCRELRDECRPNNLYAYVQEVEGRNNSAVFINSAIQF